MHDVYDFISNTATINFLKADNSLINIIILWHEYVMKPYDNISKSLVLDIIDLNISLTSNLKLDDSLKIINNVSFSLLDSEVLGIIGNSGSGKTQLILALLGLSQKYAIISGKIHFYKHHNNTNNLSPNKFIDLNSISTSELNKIRYNDISLVFQDALASLNPYLTIKSQMTEILILHKKMSYKDALAYSITMLDLVKIHNAQYKINLYPHEFSGGEAQRIMIAMALLCRPQILILDEPTSALDVTIQRKILDLIKSVQQEFKMSVILVTHDFGVLADICHKVLVINRGRMVEYNSLEHIMQNPEHPSTQILLKSYYI